MENIMTEQSGKHTFEEIHSQPAAWPAALQAVKDNADAVNALWQSGRYAQVLLTGCGSPYYIAQAVAANWRELGLPAIAAPASEIWLNPRSTYLKKPTLLVALSRSGSTTEVLRACEAFTGEGAGDVLTISCYPQAPLATLGKTNIVVTSGQEESFAQTRAFTSLYLTALACGALIAGEDAQLGDLMQLGEACTRVLAAASPFAQQHGRNAAFDRYYFLGSGERYGLACEMSLKMKEMSLSHSEPFHFMEFRHGPQTMVTESTLVVGLVSERNAEREQAVLADMRALGGTAFAIGEVGCDVNFASDLREPARNALYVVAGQLLAYEHAISKGLNPDRPHNLHAVVKL
jgi:glucosamine--fructose-6-phosphate aminotransferase (isomerizing)